MSTHLERINLLALSGFRPHACQVLPALKKHQYHVVSGYSIAGDAPKMFIKVYEYGKCKKANSKTWPLYIAKTGHKWYPGESITEYLLNQLGCLFGLNMAKSRLVFAGNQIRFLSRYFLDPKEQELVHGAEIFVGYMEDENLVHEIEAQKRAREIFTVAFVKKAIEKYFGQDADPIFRDFVKMLIFDGLVGNNDRHFYNWGVIRHLENRSKPSFSPVYDTARGLFWNEHEIKIVSLCQNNNKLNNYLNKYSVNSRPKTGIDGDPSINHFQLLDYLYNNEIGITKTEFRALFLNTRLEEFLQYIDGNFNRLLSRERRHVIKEFLKLRFGTIVNLLK